MIPRFLLFTVLLAVSSAGAAVIETSVQCIAGYGGEERGTTYCAIPGMAFAEAEARAGLESPSAPYGYSAFILATATGGRGEWPYNGAFSYASTSISALLTTPGTSRPGWLKVSNAVDFDLEGEWAGFDGGLRIGSYGAGLYSSSDETVPFGLGESFPFELDMWTAVNIAGSEFRPEYTHISVFARVQFALYEADGVTPVVPTEVGVPEPSWTGAGGILLLIGARLLRRRRRSHS